MKKLSSVKDVKNVLESLLNYYKRLHEVDLEFRNLSFLSKDTEFMYDLHDDIVSDMENFIGYDCEGDFVWNVADIYANNGCTLEQALKWLIFAYHGEDLPSKEQNDYRKAMEDYYEG